MKPLTEHQFEMLRLIRAASREFCYWTPQNVSQSFEDEIGVHSVFVDGVRTTGAIRTLTTAKLVETVDGSPSKWSRRVTRSGDCAIMFSEQFRKAKAAKKQRLRRRAAKNLKPDFEIY